MVSYPTISTTRMITKTTAVALAGALVLLSPGFKAYEALAQEVRPVANLNPGLNARTTAASGAAMSGLSGDFGGAAAYNLNTILAPAARLGTDTRLPAALDRTLSPFTGRSAAAANVPGTLPAASSLRDAVSGIDNAGTRRTAPFVRANARAAASSIPTSALSADSKDPATGVPGVRAEVAAKIGDVARIGAALHNQTDTTRLSDGAANIFRRLQDEPGRAALGGAGMDSPTPTVQRSPTTPMDRSEIMLRALRVLRDRAMTGYQLMSEIGLTEDQLQPVLERLWDTQIIFIHGTIYGGKIGEAYLSIRPSAQSYVDFLIKSSAYLKEMPARSDSKIEPAEARLGKPVDDRKTHDELMAGVIRLQGASGLTAGKDDRTIFRKMTTEIISRVHNGEGKFEVIGGYKGTTVSYYTMARTEKDGTRREVVVRDVQGGGYDPDYFEETVTFKVMDEGTYREITANQDGDAGAANQAALDAEVAWWKNALSVPPTTQSLAISRLSAAVTAATPSRASSGWGDSQRETFNDDIRRFDWVKDRTQPLYRKIPGAVSERDVYIPKAEAADAIRGAMDAALHALSASGKNSSGFEIRFFQGIKDALPQMVKAAGESGVESDTRFESLYSDWVKALYQAINYSKNEADLEGRWRELFSKYAPQSATAAANVNDGFNRMLGSISEAAKQAQSQEDFLRKFDALLHATTARYV